jgi:hypothetical protein
VSLFFVALRGNCKLLSRCCIVCTQRRAVRWPGPPGHSFSVISTQNFLLSVCVHANTRIVPTPLLRVSHAALPFPVTPSNYLSQITQLAIIQGTKLLWPVYQATALLTLVRSSLSRCPYRTQKWAKPGNTHKRSATHFMNSSLFPSSPVSLSLSSGVGQSV